MARRRRRYRREEPLPLAFYIGLLWGLIGALRTVPQFAELLPSLQSTAQLLGEVALVSGLTAIITFILKVSGYIEQGNIYKATLYTTQYIVIYVLDSVIDGLFSALGYFAGVKMSMALAKALTTFPSTG